MLNKLKQTKQKKAIDNKKYPSQLIEVRGNKDGDYIKFGGYEDESNLIYLEVGNCCVVTFRGIITCEMFTSFLTCSANEKAGLIEKMKGCMQWEQSINEKYSIGCCELDFWGDIKQKQ